MIYSPTNWQNLSFVLSHVLTYEFLRGQDLDTLKKQTVISAPSFPSESSVCHSLLSQQSTADCGGEDVTQPRRLNGSSVEMSKPSKTSQGLLLEEKPELKRVLEQRRLDLHREEELAQRPPSDLEMELRKRQQKLQEYEQEEIRRREDQQKIPEFVRVRDNLRRTQTSEQ
uniref:Zgc:195245 n=1 Tax=Myripristis murdjan TaxID=586833 RepID=A0A667ZPV3_9TELE